MEDEAGGLGGGAVLVGDADEVTRGAVAEEHLGIRAGTILPGSRRGEVVAEHLLRSGEPPAGPDASRPPAGPRLRGARGVPRPPGGARPSNPGGPTTNASRASRSPGSPPHWLTTTTRQPPTGTGSCRPARTQVPAARAIAQGIVVVAGGFEQCHVRGGGRRERVDHVEAARPRVEESILQGKQDPRTATGRGRRRGRLRSRNIAASPAGGGAGLVTSFGPRRRGRGGSGTPGRIRA